MERVHAVIDSFVRGDDGQDLTEYALLVTLIAIVAIAGVTQLGQTINNVFWRAIAASSV